MPKNLVSCLVGRLASIKFPRALQLAILRWFVSRYGVQLADATKSLPEYPSLGALFTRELKSGARPIGAGVVSPVDGVITEYGRIEQGRLLQVKGVYLPLDLLLGDAQAQARYEAGFFITFYLAPPDYHHIHAPIDGEVVSMTHMPGTLWPVNEWSVRTVPQLFVRNERVVTVLRGKEHGLVSVIKVGALNVGSIALAYDNLVSNQFSWGFCGAKRMPARREYQPPRAIQKGNRLGTFQMGSSVILLFQSNCFTPGENCRRAKIRLGESLGS